MSEQPTPKSDNFIENDWPLFVAKVTERLDAAKLTYGDKSFDRPLMDLIEETEQEIFDQMGWMAISWSQLRQIKAAVREIQRRVVADCMASPEEKK